MKTKTAALGVLFLLSPELVQAQLADCSCKDFDKLQQELDNAVTLRDRHQAKADEMEQRLKNGESTNKLRDEYKQWEEDSEKGAGKGIVSTVPGQSASIHFVARGDNLTLEGWSSPVTRDGYTVDQYDAKKAYAIEDGYKKRGQDLCDFSEMQKLRESAEKTSFCQAMSDIIVVHEMNHQKTCQKMGYIAFLLRSPIELARDEVNAYNQQIAAIEKEIGKTLKGAEVQFELSSKLTYSAQMVSFQYTHTTATTAGKIPDNDGKTWSVNLKGMHKTVADRISIAGMSCTMTPIARDVNMTIDASDQRATVRFDSFGPAPGPTMKCPRGGGGGAAMGTEPSRESVTMPLKLSSAHAEDASKGKVAEMLKGKMKVSGQSAATLHIICPK